MTVKRQSTTVVSVVALLLAGTACGELVSPPSDRRSPSVEADAETSHELEADDSRARPFAAEQEPGGVVETVDWVPVEPLDPAPVETDGLGAGVYDLSVRVAADAVDGPIDDVRLMMAEDEAADSGEKEGGDPVPLPAVPSALDGRTQGGDPVPLPADGTSGGDTTDSETSETTQPRILRVDDTIWIVFANLHVPPSADDIGLSVLLSGPQGTARIPVEPQG